jgi:alpha-D-ribose 1-methylphosphonate 5-triphosphate synthase subunit PhnG
MAAPATGNVLVKKRAGGRRVYALRFHALGERQYVTLGSDAEGWTREQAEEKLKDELARVRLGIWQPPKPKTVVPDEVVEPTFHEFASAWWEGKKHEVSANTRVDYEWQLTSHLLPYFKDYRLSQITVAEVDRYRRTKVA